MAERIVLRASQIKMVKMEGVDENRENRYSRRKRLQKWARETGIPYSVVLERVKAEGKKIEEEALTHKEPTHDDLHPKEDPPSHEEVAA